LVDVAVRGDVVVRVAGIEVATREAAGAKKAPW
jgi:hypothetical protein